MGTPTERRLTSAREGTGSHRMPVPTVDAPPGPAPRPDSVRPWPSDHGRPERSYPLDLLRGAAQVDLRHAVTISVRRACSDRLRLYFGLACTLAYAVAASVLSRSWAYGVLSALLFGFCVTFLSVIPWRVSLVSRGRRRGWHVVVFNGLLAVVAGGILFVASIASAFWLVFGTAALSRALPFILRAWPVSFVFAVTGFGIVMSEESRRRFRRHSASARRLKTLAEEARVVALRAQINPHFFFNALNTIAALIPTRPADAERAVELLAEALRPALAGDQPLLNPLGTELEIARAYAELEQLRYGESLHVEFAVSRDLDRFLVPSMCLQPLVENAIRHGAMKGDSPHRVRVGVEPAGDGIRVDIRDAPGELADPPDAAGMTEVAFPPGHALHNIATRLRVLFGPLAEMHLRVRGPGLGWVTMLIPGRAVGHPPVQGKTAAHAGAGGRP